MKVHLLRERDVPEKILEEVAHLFTQFPGALSITRSRRQVSLPKDAGGVLHWDAAFTRLEAARAENRIGPDDYLIVLTMAPNEHNWYSVQDPASPKTGFVHVADFSWATTAPPWAIVAHYVLKSVVNSLLLAAEIDWLKVAHMKPRGCFSDLCPNKSDLGLKLRTADICGDCLPMFQCRVPEELLRQIIEISEAVRLTALSTALYQKSPVVFEAWPFPVAITRHKATQNTNPVLRLLHLLDHFDSLMRYSFIANELRHDRRPTIQAKPSLGWWVEQLAKSFRDTPELKAVVRIANEAKIVALRNERRGHGWMSATVEPYDKECSVLELALSAIEVSLAPILHGYCLIRPMNVSLRNGRFVVEGDRLSGSHILHPQFVHEYETDPRMLGIQNTGRIHLATHALDKFWDCTPYIFGALCSECRHERILITDGDVYIDTLVGHRVSVSITDPTGLVV